MNRFKVKAGVHFEDGKEYAKGEIVTSSRNLTELFPEKFEDLGPAPEPEKPVNPAGPAPKLVTSPAHPDPKKAKAKSGDDWDEEKKKGE